MTIKGTEFPPLMAGSVDGPGSGQGDSSLWEQYQEQSVQLKRVERERDEHRLCEEQLVRETNAKLRASDEYLAMIAHDLSAPLNAMLGWAKILKSGKYSQDTLTHAIDIIERSARMQQRLIENLRDSTRILQGNLRLEMRSVNLRQLLEAAVDMMHSTAEAKKVIIELFSPEDADLMLTCDPVRFQQIILNLLSNAIKVTPAGCTVTLKLEKIGQVYQISVADAGKGVGQERGANGLHGNHSGGEISPRQASNLGLGQVLARQLIELHGGTLRSENRADGNGTVFTLQFAVRPVLAAVDEEGGQKEKTMAPARYSSLKGMRILVVDDEADARRLISVILGQYGAEIIAAGSANEAMVVFTEGSIPCPDLVISDISMPEQDGYELIRRIRALPPGQGADIPAIALTAFGRPSDRIAALAAGFQVHITKPVESLELLDVIVNLGAQNRHAEPNRLIPTGGSDEKYECSSN